jgi:hypothetical protein
VRHCRTRSIIAWYTFTCVGAFLYPVAKAPRFRTVWLRYLRGPLRGYLFPRFPHTLYRGSDVIEWRFALTRSLYLVMAS